MKTKRVDAKDRETTRACARDAKHQRLDSGTGDDDEEEGFVRVSSEEPAPYRKRELYRVLNAFQHSPDYGVYVCENFRDPRHQHIDAYFHEVQSSAFGISELCRKIGPADTPLSAHARMELLSFAATLESLAVRARAACETG